MLTILFVMLAEVLIYVPSIARFRKVYLEDQIAKAHLAVLALEATIESRLSDQLEMDLLHLSGAMAVMLKEPERRILMLGDTMPDTIDAVVDLREEGWMTSIMGAFETLVTGDERVLRVIGRSPRSPMTQIEVLITAAPLRREMRAYSWRILTLSLVISAITASLLFLSLHWLMVRPMRHLTERIMRFSEQPDEDPAPLPVLRRRDEIGCAEAAFFDMQRQVRAALRQKRRLAMLGGAVARINHDLRNALTSAVLASDRLSEIAEPEVQRLAPRLYAAIDRAAGLCARTLDYARADTLPIRRTIFPLDSLITEVAADAAAMPHARSAQLTVEAATAVRLNGDREQLYRLFSNLMLNAARAGANHLVVRARSEPDRVVITIVDNGPGIPERVRDVLFQPFAAGHGSEGFGLGLVIAREIAEAHGATLTMAATGPLGTEFCLTWPAASASPA